VGLGRWGGDVGVGRSCCVYICALDGGFCSMLWAFCVISDGCFCFALGFFNLYRLRQDQ
jgi:hypothetical protein